MRSAAQEPIKIMVPGRVSSAAPLWSRSGCNAIALAPIEDFRRDPDLFGEGVGSPEPQEQLNTAFKHGFSPGRRKCHWAV